MVELVEVDIKQKETLFNLLEKYLYEFSQWEPKDVDSDGLYRYEWLDYYFTEENRYPYFIMVDKKIAGFILINDYPEVPNTQLDYCVSEFFVMHKYRKQGVGKRSAFAVFNLHHGRWQLKRHPHNVASVYFWNNVIDEYTKGNYKLVESYPDPEVNYDDGTPGDVFFFEN